MAKSKAKIEVDIDKDLEKKIESKVNEWSKSCGKSDKTCAAGGGAVYGLGLIGAAVYYIQAANGFWEGVVGVLKAIVWPGFMIYELMKFLGM